jgi:hypothetical protein
MFNAALHQKSSKKVVFCKGAGRALAKLRFRNPNYLPAVRVAGDKACKGGRYLFNIFLLNLIMKYKTIKVTEKLTIGQYLNSVSIIILFFR